LFASQDDDDVAMDDEENTNIKQHQIALEGSTRVLLFSILTCLTILFHHQETNPWSLNAVIPAADVPRRLEMTSVLNGITKHIYTHTAVFLVL